MRPHSLNRHPSNPTIPRRRRDEPANRVAGQEADLLANLGDWSNPMALARELNQRAGSDVWQGGYFESGADALEAVRHGRSAVVLQAPGGGAHAVMVEPLPSGNFLVRDPLPGQTYEVTPDWIEQYVAGGVFR